MPFGKITPGTIGHPAIFHLYCGCPIICGVCSARKCSYEEFVWFDDGLPPFVVNYYKDFFQCWYALCTRCAHVRFKSELRQSIVSVQESNGPVTTYIWKKALITQKDMHVVAASIGYTIGHVCVGFPAHTMTICPWCLIFEGIMLMPKQKMMMLLGTPSANGVKYRMQF